MKKILFIVALTASGISVKAGGGWPQPKGTGYFKLSQSWIVSSRFYGPESDIVDIVTNSLYITSIYGEYGFTDRLSGIVYFPFFVRGTLNKIHFNQSGRMVPGDAVNALGDTDIAIKYGLVVNKPIVVSASLLFGLPLGVTGGGESRILQTGDGEFNQMIRFDASRSFKGFFVSLYAGFNNRTRDFSDEIRFGGEIGTSIGKFTPIIKVNVVQSLFNGGGQVAENGIFSNNTEYVSPVVELAYSFTDKWGIAASGAFAMAGRNILAAPYWSAGAFIKL